MRAPGLFPPSLIIVSENTAKDNKDIVGCVIAFQTLIKSLMFFALTFLTNCKEQPVLPTNIYISFASPFPFSKWSIMIWILTKVPNLSFYPFEKSTAYRFHLFFEKTGVPRFIVSQILPGGCGMASF
jgi:hypothetical protein